MTGSKKCRDDKGGDDYGERDMGVTSREVQRT